MVGWEGKDNEAVISSGLVTRHTVCESSKVGADGRRADQKVRGGKVEVDVRRTRPGGE